MTKLEKKIKWYKQAVLDLTACLEKLRDNTKAYLDKYAYYKELKNVYEKEAMDLKNKGQLKTLKDVELYVIGKTAEIKKEVVDLENTVKVLQLKERRLRIILEYEKTALLLGRSLEKEDIDLNSIWSFNS